MTRTYSSSAQQETISGLLPLQRTEEVFVTRDQELRSGWNKTDKKKVDENSVNQAIIVVSTTEIWLFLQINYQEIRLKKYIYRHVLISSMGIWVPFSRELFAEAKEAFERRIVQW